MRSESLRFLESLVEAPSPSGYEQPAAAVFREYVGAFADDVKTDVMGSVHAMVKGTAGAPPLMFAGHIDEIGFMVTYITDEGFCAFKEIGGHDPQILPGARVHLHTSSGPLLGVMGRLPIHLLEDEERKQVVKTHKMFIDLGLPGDVVKEKVRIGDPATFAVGMEMLGDGLAVSRSFDDKMGAWVIAEALREIKQSGGAPGDVVSAATVQEEVGIRGAITSSYGLDPVVGVAVDVGHATDYPDVDKRKHGDAKLGSGPIISRGANINPLVFELLVSAAEENDIPHQIDGQPRGTGTDANAIQLARGGKAAGLVSVPLRYMHTPTEVASLADLEAAARLLAAFARKIVPGIDFTP